jgi:hypothetical protein
MSLLDAAKPIKDGKVAFDTVKVIAKVLIAGLSRVHQQTKLRLPPKKGTHQKTKANGQLLVVDPCAICQPSRKAERPVKLVKSANLPAADCPGPVKKRKNFPCAHCSFGGEWFELMNIPSVSPEAL